LFVDLSQTAAEQLQQIDEALADYCRRPHLSGATPVRTTRVSRTTDWAA
jgi:hypothetical protein